MWTDPIVDDLDQYRAKVAEKFGYNLAEMVRYYQHQQRQAGQKVVSLRNVEAYSLAESAALYAEIYAEDPDLRALTESAIRN
jgi:hypothetical protein